FGPAGAGILLGAVLLARLVRFYRKLTLINLSLIVFGIGMICVAAIPAARGWLAAGPTPLGWNDIIGALGLIMVFAFIMGMGLAIVNVAAQTVLQERAPADMRGRVFAVQLMFGSLASIIPLVIIGQLADAFGVLQVLALVGLAFSLVVQPPWFWVVVAGIVGVVAVGADSLVRSHPKSYLHDVAHSLLFWILPALVALGAAVFLRLFGGGLAVVGGLALAGVLLTLVMLAEYLTVDPREPAYAPARLALNLATHLAAFSLYTAIYATKERSLYTGTAVAVVSTLLAVELYRSAEAPPWRTWLYAAITGLMVGQVHWALNYWPIGSLSGGVVLLLVFYLISGVVQNHLLGRLSRVVAVEFAAVTVAGMALLVNSNFWVR
ncbi:MAG: hypothetical protein NZ518_08700, partial [Dehalococcoidia bacterium]|nr:hypothetical protein [Dehalococcoidia bacterium]